MALTQEQLQAIYEEAGRMSIDDFSPIPNPELATELETKIVEALAKPVE